jgi:hypothetical protein
VFRNEEEFKEAADTRKRKAFLLAWIFFDAQYGGSSFF